MRLKRKNKMQLYVVYGKHSLESKDTDGLTVKVGEKIRHQTSNHKKAGVGILSSSTHF